MAEDNIQITISAKDMASVPIRAIERALGGMRRTVNRLGPSFRSMGRLVTGALRGITKVLLSSVKALALLTAGFIALSAAATGAFLVKATQSAARFGGKMAELFTIFDNGKEANTRLTETVKLLSIEFAQMPTDQAGAFYNAISAGATSAEEAVKLLTAANRLAVAGFSDVDTAFGAIDSTLKAYSLTADDAAHASDLLFFTVEKGLTTIDKIGKNFPRVAGQAKNAGLSIEETLGTIAIATARMGKESMPEVVTGMRAMLVALKRGAAQSKLVNDDMKTAFEFDAETLGRKGWVQLFKDMNEEMNKLSVNKAGEALRILMESPEAQNVFIAITADIEKTTRVIQEFSDVTGSVDHGFKIATETAGFQFRKLKATITVVMDDIGKLIEPFVVRFVSGFQVMLVAVRALLAKNKDEINASIEGMLPTKAQVENAATILVGGMTAAFAGVMEAGRQAQVFFRDLFEAFGEFQEANIADLDTVKANPFSQVERGILLLTKAVSQVREGFAGLGFIISNFVDAIKPRFELLWNFLKSGWAKALRAITQMWFDFIERLDVSELADAAGIVMGGLFTGISEFAAEAKVQAKSDINEFTRVIDELEEKMGGSLKDLPKFVLFTQEQEAELGRLEASVASATARLKELEESGVNASFSNVFKEGAAALRDLGETAAGIDLEAIGSEMKLGFAGAEEKLHALIAAIEKGIPDATAKAAEDFEKEIAKIVAALKDAENAAKEMEENGFRGAFNGIKAGIDALGEDIPTAFKQAKDVVVSTAQTISSEYGRAFADIVTGAETAEDAMKNFANNVLNHVLRTMAEAQAKAVTGGIANLLRGKGEDGGGFLGGIGKFFGFGDDEAGGAGGAGGALGGLGASRAANVAMSVAKDVKVTTTGKVTVMGSGIGGGGEDSEKGGKGFFRSILDNIFGVKDGVGDDVEQAVSGGLDGVPDAAGAAVEPTGGIVSGILSKIPQMFQGFMGGLGGIMEGGLGGILQSVMGMFGGGGAGGGLGGMFGGGGGGGFGKMIGGFLGSFFGPVGTAVGGFLGGFLPFANGGVITEPTMALMREAGRNEAVVPLPDGRSIPVMPVGGGSSSDGEPRQNIVNMTIEVKALDARGAVEILSEAKPQLSNLLKDVFQRDRNVRDEIRRAAGTS